MFFNLHYMSFQAQIHEGKEPAQFFSILQRLIIFKVCTHHDLIIRFVCNNNTTKRNMFQCLKISFCCKGGNSSGYKKLIEEKGIVDENHNQKLVALFRVQGTSPDNMQAIQVDQVRFDDSYIFIYGGALFIFFIYYL